MNDESLEMLGEHFIRQVLYEKGWLFISFVEEYERGYISLSKI